MSLGMLNFISAFLLMYSLHFQDPSGFWIPSAESANVKYFFNSKYISKVGSKITIWIKQVPNLQEEIDGKNLSYKLILQECNCNNYSTRLFSSINYADSGEVINSFNFKDDDLSFSPPGSVGYLYVSDICRRFNRKKN